MKAPQNCSK